MEGMQRKAGKSFSFYFNRHNLTTLLETKIVHLVQTQKIILEIYAFFCRTHVRRLNLLWAFICSSFVNRSKLDVKYVYFIQFSADGIMQNYL